MSQILDTFTSNKGSVRLERWGIDCLDNPPYTYHVLVSWDPRHPHDWAAETRTDHEDTARATFDRLRRTFGYKEDAS